MIHHMTHPLSVHLFREVVDVPALELERSSTKVPGEEEVVDIF